MVEHLRMRPPGRYGSRKVSLLKIGLLAIAVSLIVLVIVLSSSNNVNTQLKLTFSELKTDDAEPSKMIKPRYQGVDSKGQPYNILADVARQKTEEEVELKNLQADITLHSGVWVSLLSKQGIIDLEKKILDVMGDVHVFYDNGYEAWTESAHINLEEGEAFSNHPVTIQGAPGILEATGFELFKETETIHFIGPVRLTIWPEHLNN